MESEKFKHYVLAGLALAPLMAVYLAVVLDFFYFLTFDITYLSHLPLKDYFSHAAPFFAGLVLCLPIAGMACLVCKEREKTAAPKGPRQRNAVSALFFLGAALFLLPVYRAYSLWNVSPYDSLSDTKAAIIAMGVYTVAVVSLFILLRYSAHKNLAGFARTASLVMVGSTLTVAATGLLFGAEQVFCSMQTVISSDAPPHLGKIRLFSLTSQGAMGYVGERKFYLPATQGMMVLEPDHDLCP